MATANPKQINVFVVNGSLNNNQLNQLNTIAPIENPIKREGHICPSNAIIMFLTEYMNNIEIGMPINTVSQ
jgi:hypothetical protein